MYTGGTEAEHIPAIWQRRACLSGQRASQDRDIGPDLPLSDQLQVNTN